MQSLESLLDSKLYAMANTKSCPDSKARVSKDGDAKDSKASTMTQSSTRKNANFAMLKALQAPCYTESTESILVFNSLGPELVQFW